MSLIRLLFQSSLGKKYLMAVSGIGLFLFVIGHMLGNLQIFLGPETLNRYAAFLKSQPELLWFARIGLLVLVLVHIWSAAKLTWENRAARPVRYAEDQVVAASYASRTMIWSGLIIAAFVVYHLLHFSVGVVEPEFMKWEDAAGRHDVYRMVVAGFSRPWVSGFYILAMALLCMHLSHGVRSMFQSLGWRNERYAPAIDRFAQLAAWIIFLGNSSIPLAVLLGYGH